MTGPSSQSPRDHILWIWREDGAEQIKETTGMRYATLLPILEELAKEGRIKFSPGKHGDRYL